MGIYRPLPNTVRTNTELSVQKYPLLWIYKNYFATYKANTFIVPSTVGSFVYAGNAADYAKVTEIDLADQDLTTDFTEEMLGKFVNLESLTVNDNDINVLIPNENLKTLIAFRNNFEGVLDLSNATELENIFFAFNDLTAIICNKSFVKSLSLNDNNLTVFSFAGYNNLEGVSLSGNPITDIIYTAMPNLVYCDIFDTNITDLDVSVLGSGELKTLRINGNKFTLAIVKSILEQLYSLNKIYNGFIRYGFLPNVLRLNITNATNNSISLTNNVSIATTDNFSIKFKIYLLSTSPQYILSHGSNNDNRFYISSNHIGFVGASGQGWVAISFLSNLVLNTLYSVEFRRISGTVSVLINGVVQGSVSSNAYAFTWNRIGRRPSTTENPLLSYLYDLTIEKNSVLLHSYAIDEYLSNTVTDSISGNNGTISSYHSWNKYDKQLLNTAITDLQSKGNTVQYL